MPAAVRKGDMSQGHDGYAPRANDQGSPNVFVNGKPQHRVGDHWPSHTNQHDSHEGQASEGSSNVFCNGKAKCRVGDKTSDGDTMAEGSPNYYIN